MSPLNEFLLMPYVMGFISGFIVHKMIIFFRKWDKEDEFK